MNTAIATVPNLRFSGFVEPWTTKKLKDFRISVIDGDRGKNYPNGDDFTPEGFCVFLNAKNVTKSGFDFREMMFISDKKDKSLSKGKLAPNDVVLTTRGTVGNIALFDSAVAYDQLRINSGMVLLRATKSELSPQFLRSAFFAPPLDREVKKTAFGSAQPQLTVKGIYALKFGAPALPEQQKIADFLTAVDERIQQLIQKKALLEDYKKGVMQQLFTQTIRFKDDNGNDFPYWEEKKLGDLCNDEISNGVFNDPAKVGSGYRLVNVSDMYRGSHIDINSLNRLELERSEFEKNQVRYGDILFTRSSLVAAGIAWSNVNLSNANDITFDGHLMKISPDLSLFHPVFLAELMMTHEVRKQFVRRGKTGTMTTIGQKDIASVLFRIPTLSEQTKIADFLSTIDRKIETVATQITETHTFKRGLLQQMFV